MDLDSLGKSLESTLTKTDNMIRCLETVYARLILCAEIARDLPEPDREKIVHLINDNLTGINNIIYGYGNDLKNSISTTRAGLGE